MAPTAHSTLPYGRRTAAARRPFRSALVALLAVCGMLLTLTAVASPAAAATTTPTATETYYARAVLSVLNSERSAHGLAPLRWNWRLRLSARWHNLAMARANQLSHQLPGELDFARRIDRAGYNWTYAGENIGWNSVMTKRGVVALEKIMYNERPPNDGHRQNILSRNYRNVGVDVYLDRVHHKVWLTTDFGRL